MQHIAIPDGAGGGGDKAAPLFGHAGRTHQPRQALLLQQAMNGRARHAVVGDRPAGFEQARELAELIALDIECTDGDELAGGEIQVRNISGQQLYSVPIREAKPTAA